MVVAERFEAFSGQHFGLLALFVAGAVGLVALGRMQRRSSSARLTSRVLAVAVACVAVSSQAFQLTPGDFDPATSLPLQLCDLASVTAVWALWSHRSLPTALTYYWGLTLTVQGVLTPSLAEEFPHPLFFAFWALHFLVVWTALFLTFGLGLGPRWRDYRMTVVVTLAWAVVVYLVDVTWDLNYGYLVRKPASTSLLDSMGPWPVYLLVAQGILLAGWALMTWPWVAARRRTGSLVA